MKEHPIIFSAGMVRAILEGRKTQTRRVVKPQPSPMEFDLGARRLVLDGDGLYWELRGRSGTWRRALEPLAKCRYGVSGDRLWVRETWATPGNFDHIKPRDLAASHFSSDMLVYRATEQYGDAYYRWRPSIFMPRWASRITLEIVGVRVERLQDITNSEALVEGIPLVKGHYPDYENSGNRWDTPSASFISLWDSINAKRGFPWSSNPWIWVVEFKQI